MLEEKKRKKEKKKKKKRKGEHAKKEEDGEKEKVKWYEKKEIRQEEGCWSVRENARVLSSCAAQRLRVSEGASQRARNAQKKFL